MLKHHPKGGVIITTPKGGVVKNGGTTINGGTLIKPPAGGFIKYFVNNALRALLTIALIITPRGVIIKLTPMLGVN